MARLIDANAYAAELWKLRENYQMLDDTHTADKIMHGIFRAEQVLKEQPAVDAVPVRHGRWQGVSPLVDSLECSECRYCIIGEEFITPYCPWCGAKMSNGERKGGDE